MKHHSSERFWQLYEELPERVRAQADKSFAQLRLNPRHPSLHFKQAGRFWSARIGSHHRAQAVQEGDDLVWFWIGDHDAYDRLLRRG
ncbi:MAG: hypothetical protein U0X73_05260 [Thermoanaerobaculia bacterium]